MALNVYIGNLNGTHLLSFWKVYCKAVNKEFIFFSLICPTKLGATLPCKEFCSLVILIANYKCYFVVQSLSCVLLFASPWTVACQASLSITNSQSLPKLMSIKLVMPSNHFILYCHLLLLPSIFPSIRVFSSELVLHIRWPKYWSFSFSISPSNEYSELISFRIDWLDLLAVLVAPPVLLIL